MAHELLTEPAVPLPRAIDGALRALGVLAVVALVAASVVLWSVVRRGFSARDEPSQLEAVVARRLRAWSTSHDLRRLRRPASANGPAAIAAGLAHWADHCALCHSNDGSGRTEIGERLYPRAPDMRSAPTQELTDGELYDIIQNGIRLTGMPAWGEPRTDDPETWSLVAFIRHLPEATPAEIESMRRLNPRSPAEVEEELEERHFLRREAEGESK